MSKEEQFIETISKLSEKVSEIRVNCLSKNGYPIFDLMIPSYPSDGYGGRLSGYISASGISFYTEDEKVLSQFNKALDYNNVKDAIEFMKLNPQTIQRTQDIKTMDGSEQLAFGHLINERSRQETLKRGYYGVAHLVLEDKVVVFRQGDPKISSIFKSDKDLNDPIELNKAQQTLYQLWEEEKIKPEIIFEGLAAKRLKQALNGSSYEHKLFSLIELVQDFSREFSIPMKIKSPDATQLELELHSHNFHIKATQNDKVILTVNSIAEENPKSYAQVIDKIYTMTYGQKLENFMNKKKLKP